MKLELLLLYTDFRIAHCVTSSTRLVSYFTMAAKELYSKTFSSIISGDSLKVKFNVKYLRKYIGQIKIIFYALNNILNQYFRKSVWWRWQRWQLS